jgi:hypothetical protein
MSIAINVDVEPVEIDGKHWVSTRANGRETKREGPFPDAAAAQAAADRHMRRRHKAAGGCGTAEHSAKGARKNVHSDIKANVASPTTSLIDNDAFVSDMARYTSGDLTEKQIRKKYRLAESDWIAMAENEALIERIEDESTRRLRDGSTARQRAQIHFAAAPNVLGGILSDGNAPARSRIESAKELRAIAVPPAQAAAGDSARFVIRIDLTADGSSDARDIIQFNKPIAVGVEDDTGAAPQELVAIVAASKPTDGGSGNPL